MDDQALQALNRAWWDERVPTHVTGGFYDVDAFLAGRSTLRPFEAPELGDVGGATLVHLQCHFGLDTLSWARRGAVATGVDFSPNAVAAARDLAARGGVAAEFVEANVYEDLTVTDSYFEEGPILSDEPGSYAAPGARTVHDRSVTWSHGLGSVITALAQAGLRIEFLHEHPFTLRACWPFLERRADRTYHMPPGRPEVPLLYSVKATLPS